MEHLRPHPTKIPIYKTLKMKQHFSSKSNHYTYAFNKKDYVDFNVYNKLKYETEDLSNVGELLRTSIKPVVFFLTYDVGPKKDTYVRHIVCCVANKKEILFFDMRDLSDISPKHQKFIEKELEKASGLEGIKLVNAACLSDHCIYLQRFKGKKEHGWCIAWSLYFLNKIVHDPIPSQKQAYLKKLYKHINDELEKNESNMFIEEWYVKSLKSFHF